MIKIQTDDFDLTTEIQQLRARANHIGAVSMFLGTMRDINLNDAVSELWLEHYPGMTEKAIQSILDQAYQRWNIQSACVIHRIGTLKPTDQIVLVATCSQHREAAISATSFIIDYLKTEAPFWKKETTNHGKRWLDTRNSDQLELKKWETKNNGLH